MADLPHGIGSPAPTSGTVTSPAGDVDYTPPDAHFDRNRYGDFALPHPLQFITEFGGGTRAYLHDRWDEAVRWSRADALTMEHDPFLMGLMQERKLAVVSQKWHIEPEDAEDEDQRLLADVVQKGIEAVPNLKQLLMCLLHGIFWGRSATHCDFEWKTVRVRPRQPKEKESPEGDGGEEEPEEGPPEQFAMHPAGPGGFKARESGKGTLRPQGRARRRADINLPPREGLREETPGPQPTSDSPQFRQNQELGVPASGGEVAAPETFRVLTYRDWRPVHGDKVGHQMDGTPYILVRQSADIPGSETIITSVGGAGLLLKGTWRQRVILHAHERIDKDFFLEFEQAEAVFGSGVRSVVFWLNYVKWEYQEWLSTFMERMGLGTRLWLYEAGNAAHLKEVQQAALQFSRKTNLFVPVKPGEGAGKGYAGGIQVIEVPTAGCEVLRAQIEYIDKLIERYVVGQEGSASATSSSGHSNHESSEFMQDTKHAIREYDSGNIADTLTRDLVKPIQFWTCQANPRFAHLSGVELKWQYDVGRPNPKEVLESVKAASELGVEFVEDEVRALTGLSDPQEGDDVVGGQQKALGGLDALLGGKDKPREGGEDEKPFPFAKDARGRDHGRGSWDELPAGSVVRLPPQGQAVDVWHYDAEFEDKHPRADDGKFGEGSGSPKKKEGKPKRPPRPQPIRGAQGTKLLADRLAAQGIPLDPSKLVSDHGGVEWLPPWSREPPRTVAQFVPVTGGLTLVDHPGLTEQEKIEYATHELTHLLDIKLGPEGAGGFKKSTSDSESPLGKIAHAALADEPFRQGIVKLGYREHELPGEALAYLGSRWARKRMGQPVTESPALDALLPEFEKLLLENAGR